MSNSGIKDLANEIKCSPLPPLVAEFLLKTLRMSEAAVWEFSKEEVGDLVQDKIVAAVCRDPENVEQKVEKLETVVRMLCKSLGVEYDG